MKRSQMNKIQIHNSTVRITRDGGKEFCDWEQDVDHVTVTGPKGTKEFQGFYARQQAVDYVNNTYASRKLKAIKNKERKLKEKAELLNLKAANEHVAAMMYLVDTEITGEFKK